MGVEVKREPIVAPGRYVGRMWLFDEPIETSDWLLGLLRFASGEKNFDINGVKIEIPDSVRSFVKVGERTVPYDQFHACFVNTLYTFIDTYTFTMNRVDNPRREDEYIMNLVLACIGDMPRSTFWGTLPPENPQAKMIADEIQRLHDDPGGIKGLRRARPQDW